MDSHRIHQWLFMPCATWILTAHVAKQAFEGKLRCHRHYAGTRLANPSSLEGATIVLTTYDTVSAEWATGLKTNTKSVLFGVRWARIVLDEGKLIC